MGVHFVLCFLLVVGFWLLLVCFFGVVCFGFCHVVVVGIFVVHFSHAFWFLLVVWLCVLFVVMHFGCFYICHCIFGCLFWLGWCLLLVVFMS